MSLRRAGVVVAAAFLVIVGIVIAQVMTRAQQEDIFLEAAESVGQDPFTTVAVVTPTTDAATSATTALFGGSGSRTHCDSERLIAFLTDPANAEKATAWIEALNGDPTLRWGENQAKTKLEVGDIADYIRELTPTHLSRDTRVTNYGFKNGEAVPHQALLQKGMAVLVDRDGVPRVKCKCGNPLTPPQKVDNPHYVGECWPGCHDKPPCSRNCAETTTTQDQPTTTTQPSTTTTLCQTPRLVAAGCGPPPKATTTTRPPPTTTTTQPSTAGTTTTVVRTTTTAPTTSTTCSPNDTSCQP